MRKDSYRLITSQTLSYVIFQVSTSLANRGMLIAKGLNFIISCRYVMLDRKAVSSLVILILLLGFTQTYILQPVQGQIKYEWRSLPPLPTPRSEVTSAVIENDMYVIGGFEEPGVASDKVEIYNAVEKSWRSGPPLPTPLHHTVAVSLDDKIYVMGGYLEGWISVNTVYIYDTEDRAWSEGPNMPRDKAAFTAQVLDGKIYTVGGASSRIEGGRLRFEVLSINEYYDPETREWRTASPLPSPREHLASAAVGGKMYVIGGRSLTLQTNTGINEEYDPQTDTWTRRAPMPTPRGGIVGAALSGKVFVFGGESGAGTFNEAEEYDPSTDEWRQVEPMPTARHGLAAATVLGKILVVAGGKQPGLYVSDVNEALMPDPPAVTQTTSIVINTIVADREGYGGVWLWFGLGVVVLAVSSVVLLLRLKRR